MSSANADPATLLSNRWWRIRHSAWLLAVILGFGLLSFVGFVYTGLRVRARKFWIAMAAGSAGSALCWVVSADTDPATQSGQISDLGGSIVITVWAVQIVYALIINRDYLRWRAARTGVHAWYNQPDTTTPAAKAPLAPAPVTPPASPRTPAVDSLTGDSEQYYASTAQTPPTPAPPTPEPAPRPEAGPPNVNAAEAADLVAALRIDRALADRIVAARQVHGDFHSLDDLAAAAALQPHELVKLRGTVSFQPAPTPPPSRPTTTDPSPGEQSSGRILDY